MLRFALSLIGIHPKPVMDMRDQIAAQFGAAMICNQSMLAEIKSAARGSELKTPRLLSAIAYEYADAMMVMRERGK